MIGTYSRNQQYCIVVQLCAYSARKIMSEQCYGGRGEGGNSYFLFTLLQQPWKQENCRNIDEDAVSPRNSLKLLQYKGCFKSVTRSIIFLVQYFSVQRINVSWFIGTTSSQSARVGLCTPDVQQFQGCTYVKMSFNQVCCKLITVHSEQRCNFIIPTIFLVKLKTVKYCVAVFQ